MNTDPQFCFCTLALTNKYRSLALLLAKDLEKLSPNINFIILTDNPDDFSEQPNVKAFKHQQQGIKCYHDKRFVIAKALSMFNSCIFIDADMRILAPVATDIEWLQVPGISARACDVMPKKYAKILNGTADAKFRKEYKVTQNAAEKLNIKLEDQNVRFVYEYLFTITKDSGKEIEFLKHWEMLANYYELNGVYDGEGNAVGLAAAKAGLEVRWSEMKGISFFKAQVERYKIQKGQSQMEVVSKYFQEQKMLEYPTNYIWKKVFMKIIKQMEFLFYWVRLRILTLHEFNFYYRQETSKK